jgi:hypothetical protein
MRNRDGQLRPIPPPADQWPADRANAQPSGFAKMKILLAIARSDGQCGRPVSQL